MPISREAVDEILSERGHRRSSGSQLGGFAIALLVHVGLIAFGLFAAFAADDHAALEFVAVELLPAAALGVEAPAPAPAPPAEPEVAPEPEPQPEEPPPAEPAFEQPALTPDEKAPKEPAPQEPRPRPTPSPSASRAGPRGSPDGTAGAVAQHGAAVAGFDNPNFTYGYYVDQMLGLIRSQWVRPPLGSGVEVVVHFRIQKTGKVRDVTIAQSSGYNSFDLAGLRAVQSASPLPPLPRSFSEGSLGVNLIFR